LLLKKLKDDPDIKVRRAAADALASCGEDPRPVIAEVKEILAKEQDAAIKATLKWLVEQVK
jgi:uncharacterized protein (DUF2336 family)